MSKNEPEFPLAPMIASAAALHETMTAYVQVGFTRPEALQIVIAMLMEAIRQSAREGPG